MKAVHRLSLPLRLLVLALSLGNLSADWARLKDGSVVEVRSKKAKEVLFQRSDGTIGTAPLSEIVGWLEPPAARRIVDDVVTKIGHPEHHDFVRKRLRQLGMAAVPRLLVHLSGRELERRRAAAAALQMAWSSKAQQPVSALLSDEDEFIRRMAMHLVQRHFTARQRMRVLAPLAQTSKDPEIAGPALAFVLAQSPKPKNMLAALKTKAIWPALHPLLPRYQAQSFLPWSLKMLKEGSPDEKASALIALIYQMNDADTARAPAAQLLHHRSAKLRDLSAEYLRWHGRPSDVHALEKRMHMEDDPHTKASMGAAVEAILQRATAFTQTQFPSRQNPTWPEDPAAAYALGFKRLRENPDLTTRAAILKLLTRAPFEPVYEFVESARLRPDPAHVQRLDLISCAFAYPTSEERRRAAIADRKAKPIVPVAKTLMPPVHDYFDAERKSFGRLVPPGDNPFSNSYHIGDDVSFGQQQVTVVAIGDGRVRIAQAGSPSWGGLVVIEHRAPDGTSFCSLYGHLGPLITVIAGDLVNKGQKLGSLGRDYVFATGGYRSHLHFGIHRGTFGDGGRPWVGGYLAPEKFERVEELGWIDPQPFVKSRLATP